MTSVLHSALGASGAERWMRCPGSVTLLHVVGAPVASEDPDYRREGTAAHSIAAECLLRNEDAWEWAGRLVEGVEVTPDIASAVQVYLDECRSLIEGADDWGCETFFHGKDIHPSFFGTCDFWAVRADTLFIRDYKNGVGVVVEAFRNPQTRYYAYGKARGIDDPRVTKVNLGIVQPNAFRPDGAVSTEDLTMADLFLWAETELFPAMQRTEVDDSLEVGAHCRFCPAKLACPAQVGLFAAVTNAKASDAVDMTDAELARVYALTEPVRMFVKAVKDQALARMMAGRKLPGLKLAATKADRVFKQGAITLFLNTFGDDAYQERKLKSPAQMEKAGPGAKALVKEWAFQPVTGYKIVDESDKAIGYNPPRNSEKFSGALYALENTDVEV